MSSTLSSGRWVLPLVGFEARFGPTDLGAHFDFTVDISPTGVMALIAPLFKSIATRRTQKYVNAFKDSVESENVHPDG